tara:strand:+ start:459 stop:581 length:123 start_codon:yes stop_codon:yes gene_type:complete
MYVGDIYADFLMDFTYHSVFEALSRLDKSGEDGVLASAPN